MNVIREMVVAATPARRLHKSLKMHASSLGEKREGGARRAHQTAQRGKCNRERRMVSEEKEVKVMEEGRM